MTVVIVGSGLAGLAAATAAVRAGARVTLVDGGPGASALWTGAVHGGGVTDEARALAATLDVRLSPGAIATTAGAVRAVEGRHAALLDIRQARAEGRRFAVVACPRPGWDAGVLARALGDDAFVLDATVLRHKDERVLPDAELATRLDDDDRLGWLAERLREALARAGRSDPAALLFPPSLGLSAGRAEALSSRVGLPCGEASGQPGGPCGLRFERARDAALLAAGVKVVAGRAIALETDEALRVRLEGGSIEAGAVVVATGGLVGGGLAYTPSEATLAQALPEAPAMPFQVTVEGPFRVGAHGRPLDLPGSLFGRAPESLAWPFSRDPLLERAGVLAADDGWVTGRVFVAGELRADAPHTWLEAVLSGLRAGSSAAREALRATPGPASRGAASPTPP